MHARVCVYLVCVRVWVNIFVTWTRDLFFSFLSLFFFSFLRNIVSSGRSCQEDGRFPRTRFERVSRRIVHEAFIRRDTCVTTARHSTGAPGLGGILLSVRVSREDDNAHGIAVASFSAHLIARQGRGRDIVVLCADSSGNARR